MLRGGGRARGPGGCADAQKLGAVLGVAAEAERGGEKIPSFVADPAPIPLSELERLEPKVSIGQWPG